MNDSSRESNKKRRRTDDGVGTADEPQLGLLWLYQSDLGDRILSYASGADLCTLDILNKQFNRLTNDQWETVTKDRFGMNNGKEGWKIGTSFLRPPIFVPNISNNEEDGDGNGTSAIATNESIIISVTNNDDRNQSKELEIRNATNLDYIRTSHAPINNWTVSICGRVGSEIIVTANDYQVCAKRGNDIQRWQYIRDEDEIRIETIGCETHLIVPHDGVIRLYEVNQGKDNCTNELLSLKNEIRVEEGAGDEYDRIERTISWGPEKTHFVVGYPHKICVWKFEAANNEISLIKTITVPNWEVTNVALANDYIVASSEYRNVYIWNRSTGDKMFYPWRGSKSDLLCDVEPDEEEEDEYIQPLCLTCLGHILVSTSHAGCALCIWDMRTGALLKRHEQRDMLPEMMGYGDDMVYLQGMNSFLCMGPFKYTDAWAFPTNQSQYDKVISVCRRVEIEESTRLHGLPEL